MFPMEAEGPGCHVGRMIIACGKCHGLFGSAAEFSAHSCALEPVPDAPRGTVEDADPGSADDADTVDGERGVAAVDRGRRG